MRKTFIALVVLFALVPIACAAQEYVSVGSNFAAYTKQDMELVVDLALQNDKEAIIALAMQGRVFLLEGGNTVFLMDSSWGLVQLRMKGNPESFWTVREAIRTK